VSAQLAAGRSQSPSVVRLESDKVTSPGPSDMNSSISSTSSSNGSAPATSRNLSGDSLLLDSALEFSRDWRDYRCKTWQLEPTVRLLSWAGKSIEPYGVDYILQKLGFSHARITIPKWMQRGFCDPLDLLLSLLVYQMVDLAKRENPRPPARPNNQDNMK